MVTRNDRFNVPIPSRYIVTGIDYININIVFLGGGAKTVIVPLFLCINRALRGILARLRVHVYSCAAQQGEGHLHVVIGSIYHGWPCHLAPPLPLLFKCEHVWCPARWNVTSLLGLVTSRLHRLLCLLHSLRALPTCQTANATWSQDGGFRDTFFSFFFSARCF